MQSIYVGSSSLVTLGPVLNFQTQATILGADVQYTLKNSAGTTITSGSLPEVGEGYYQGVMSGEETAYGQTYTLTVVLTKDAATLTKVVPLFAVYDGSISVEVCVTP